MSDDLRVLNRLNLETRVHHSEADADVDHYLFRSHVTAADYRTFLTRVYGFVAPLEAALTGAPGIDEVLDLKARAKAALVAHDLLTLGMTLDEVRALPQCEIPTFRGPASALGWLYVVERPHLVLAAAIFPLLAVRQGYTQAVGDTACERNGMTWREQQHLHTGALYKGAS